MESLSSFHSELLDCWLIFYSFSGKNIFCLVIYHYTGRVEKLNVDLTSLVSGTSSGTIFFTELVCLPKSLLNWASTCFCSFFIITGGLFVVSIFWNSKFGRIASESWKPSLFMNVSICCTLMSSLCWSCSSLVLMERKSVSCLTELMTLSGTWVWELMSVTKAVRALTAAQTAGEARAVFVCCLSSTTSRALEITESCRLTAASASSRRLSSCCLASSSPARLASSSSTLCWMRAFISSSSDLCPAPAWLILLLIWSNRVSSLLAGSTSTRAGRDTSGDTAELTAELTAGDTGGDLAGSGLGGGVGVVVVIGALRAGVSWAWNCGGGCAGLLLLLDCEVSVGILSFLKSFCRRGLVMIFVFAKSCGEEFLFSVGRFRRPSWPLLTIWGCGIGFEVDWSIRLADKIFLLTREFRLGRCNLGLSRLSLTPPKLSASERGLEDCRGCCFSNLCCSFTKSVETRCFWFWE